MGSAPRFAAAPGRCVFDAVVDEQEKNNTSTVGRRQLPRLPCLLLLLVAWACQGAKFEDEEKVREALAALEAEDSAPGHARRHFQHLRQLQKELEKLEEDQSDNDSSLLAPDPEAPAGNSTDARRHWLSGPQDGDNASCADENTSSLLSNLSNMTLMRSLVRRFFVAEDTPSREAAALEKLLKKRHRYISEKMETDLSVVQHFSVPSVLPAWPSSEKQVAFLFLTVDGLDFEDVWDRFFADVGAYGAYSIYVHRASSKEAGGRRFAEGFGGWSRSWSKATTPLSRWGAVEIPQVENRWCALFGVEVALLHAALQDARNQQFVFLSHNTIPLKSFDYVYKQLVVNSPGTSKFCFAEPAFHKMATSETIRNELRRQCVFRDFYRSISPRILKHHQWVVLKREHAEIVIQRAAEALALWKETWQYAAPDLLNMGEGCSDESVPGTALLLDIDKTERSTGNTWVDLTRLGVEQQCLTYVLWRHCFTESRLDHSENIAKDLDIVFKHGKFRMLTDREFNFFKSALKRELNGYPAVFDTLSIEYLWKLVQEGFMFARKFVKELRVTVGNGNFPLAEVLPALWDLVDDFNASQRIWTRLSTEGKPRRV
ncbi:BC10 [Symbiodinium sp. CCMP2592]|nr:BC10 [Symbiodinium sp. CCMP2592]